MSYKFIKKTLVGDICKLTINIPNNKNKLDTASTKELTQAFKSIEKDDGCKTVILAGDENYFCGGGELGNYTEQSTMEIREFGAGFMELIATITDLSKPVIAAVEGDALCGGFSLLEACDLSMAAEDAKFGVTEIKYGLAPMMALAGVMQVLKRKGAMEFALLGETISAEKAKEIGLINWICKKEEVMDKAMQTAVHLSGQNPVAMALCKKLYKDADGLIYGRQIGIARDILISMLKSEDAKEAYISKEENRNAVWKNK
jgi:enoyl-CoA hydratase